MVLFRKVCHRHVMVLALWGGVQLQGAKEAVTIVWLKPQHIERAGPRVQSSPKNGKVGNGPERMSASVDSRRVGVGRKRGGGGKGEGGEPALDHYDTPCGGRVARQRRPFIH